MSHGLEFIFAPLQSLLFGNAGWSAHFDQEFFWVLAVLNHGFDFGLSL
jgi:hypothetical protein